MQLWKQKQKYHLKEIWQLSSFKKNIVKFPEVEKVCEKIRTVFGKIDPHLLKFWLFVKSSEVTLLSADFTKVFVSILRRKMEQIILAYGFPKETVTAIKILHKNTKATVCSPDGDIDAFDIVTGVLHEDTLALFLFMIGLDYVLSTSIDLMK